MKADPNPSATGAAPPDKLRFQFGLKHILYAMALFGASLGLCGLPGLVVAPLILMIWWAIFRDVRKQIQLQSQARVATKNAQGQDPAGGDAPPRPAFTLVELLVVIAIIGILLAFLLPAISRSGPHYRYRRNLTYIAGALRSYQAKTGRLPPAYVADASGRPLYSWRVLILPYLGQEKLYQSFHLDEPWDGPNNLKLLDQRPEEFTTGGTGDERRRMTACQAVVGPDTAWPGATPRPPDEIKDPPATTLLVVECESHPVPWTAPQDLTEAEAMSLLCEPPRFPEGHWNQGFLWSTWHGRFVATAAGYSAIPFSASDPGALQQMLRVADGLPEADDPGLWTGPAQRVFHYVNWARLAFFLVVAFWPVVWLREEFKTAA